MNLKKAVKSKRSWAILTLALANIFNWNIPDETINLIKMFTS